MATKCMVSISKELILFEAGVEDFQLVLYYARHFRF